MGWWLVRRMWDEGRVSGYEYVNELMRLFENREISRITFMMEMKDVLKWELEMELENKKEEIE